MPQARLGSVLRPQPGLLLDRRVMGRPDPFGVLDVRIRRSRIGELLADEGPRWRQQKTWFGERPDPAFAEKGDDRSALHHAPGG